nr:SDR family oxidoreductase [Sneathia sanguinegens]
MSLGFLVTNQNKALLFNEDGSPTARTGKILRNTPMDRFGEPEEMLGAIEFLVDNEKASFVTGIIIHIDGGFSAYSGV